MATGTDQTAYLGSSIEHSMAVPKPPATKEKINEIKETRKTRSANLRGGAKELLALIDEQITKEDRMEILRGKAVAHVKNGRSVGAAMSDELVYEAGRIDAFNEVRTLLRKALGEKKNG